MSIFQGLTVNEDGFAFNSTTGESYTVNNSGRLVLQLLQKGENRNQIINFIAGEFGINRYTAERDIADFFQQLNVLGLTINNP